MLRFEPVPSRRKIAGQAVWFALWMGVVIVALFLEPSKNLHGTHQQLGLAPCPAVLALSKPCPACGLTTSFTAAIHGDLVSAFRAHPMGPVLLTLFTASAWLAAWGWIKKIRVNTNTAPFNWGMCALITVFLVYGVLRAATTKTTYHKEPVIWQREDPKQ